MGSSTLVGALRLSGFTSRGQSSRGKGGEHINLSDIRRQSSRRCHELFDFGGHAGSRGGGGELLDRNRQANHG